MAASADDLVFYPRAYVGLSTSLEGTDEVDTGIVPTRASVSIRPHNQADTAEIIVHGSALPFDPRQIGGVFVSVFMGAVDHIDSDVNTSDFLRFVGFVDEMEPKRDDKGPAVSLKARDLSAILRDFKPLPASVVPQYTDTVGAAIQRILDAVPGVANDDGSPRLSLQTAAGVTDRPLGGAIPARGQTAAVRLPPDVTAWQAIEHICGLVSLLVSVELNTIVVRTSSQTYGHTSEPVTSFAFGGESGNLLEVTSAKKFVRNRRGVKVTAYDPTTRQRIEALYPPDGQVLPNRRPRAHVGGTVIRSGGRSRRGSAQPAPDRDVFPAPLGMHSQDACLNYAQRIYTERSRQEIEGRIITPIWTPEILGLKNADRFTLRIQPELEARLRNTNDQDAAIRMLRSELGVSDDAARALIRASRNRPTDTWYARTITHDFDAESKSTTSVEYINLIQVTNA